MTEPRPVAVVTGASSGIGAAYAKALASRGFDLALVARRRDLLEKLAAELQSAHHIQVDVLAADLTKDDQLSAVETYLARAERLEFLVNNAGFGTVGRFFEIPVESQDAMHRLHVLATMRLTHAALKGMVARGRGSVVNVSSVAAFFCRPGGTSYYATKAWINCFTEGLYLELQSVGSPVRVQTLCPGYTFTGFHDVMGVDRGVVGRGWWMQAEEVVAASLQGLEKNQLFVAPGWRYRLIVALLRAMPRAVQHRVATWGPSTVKPPASARPRA